jgi:hypothetical protein
VSIGAVGSWFCNWVVSNDRKSLKLLAKVVSELAELVLLDELEEEEVLLTVIRGSCG